MFETLMGLPLLSGASHEQISGFIAKTHLDFSTFNPGDEIVALNSRCRTLRCILSGDAVVSHPLFENNIIVNEVAGPGRFLGAERLFGLENNFCFRVEALTRCGTMEISKPQYLRLLQSDQIFLINYLNYLSRTAQRNEDLLVNSQLDSIASLFFHILELTTSRDSRNITIASRRMPMRDFLVNKLHMDSAELQSFIDAGLVHKVNDHTIQIPDRQRIFDAGREIRI